MKPIGRPLHLLLAAALLAFVPGVARAEDGEPQDDTAQKIRQQMERILELMRDNERDLLRLSSGLDGEPQRIDVDVPPPQGGSAGGAGGDSSGEGASGEGASGEGASGSSSSGSSSSGATAGGDDVRRELERLLEETSARQGTIPKELESLVKMIPT